MKKAEDSDVLILRLVKWAGKSGEVKVKIPPGATSAVLTNLRESFSNIVTKRRVPPTRANSE
jgi:hypothetical protein